MPLYEYKCHGCGKTFEVIQKFSDEPLKTHPECGGEVERLLSAPALQFKGSGWYVTDYGKSNGGSKAEGGSEGKSESKPGSGEKKSDAKPSAESKTPSTSESKPSSTSSSTSDSK